MTLRYTIDQFRTDYPNDDACLDKIFQLRFKGLICPKCESTKEFTRVKNRRSYQCPNCSQQVYPTKDTVFEKTTTPLTYWFYAIFLQTTTRNGVAAKELERQLNVCYKTALRMSHQIKILMANNRLGKLTGKVQVDESYFGMKFDNMHSKKRATYYNEDGTRNDNKAGVMGFVTDDKKVIFEVMDDTKTFKERVRKHVDPSAILVTDSHLGYKGLDINYLKHEVINHLQNEFKRGEFHTNGIENAWSNLKRTIKGTHIHVSVKYLQLYADEVAFRLMNKDKQDIMFDTILSHVA
ncbi:IS1595 family transposase [Sediminibacterium sp.]|uniref:IS1595 family transposase n=1 Tax=Sediminibacterium sp. TaxID=1917865 RepID=UPI0025E15550|nr:IS1595 family transposase [Sediminibacterium sp.]MBW0179295.1 IS1595 family transposase [Sediminibacterium sp.]